MIHLLLAVIYLSFISLGLPDGLLGAAWPEMHLELGANVSYAGVIAMIISAGTIFSSLMSDRLACRLGAGKLTAISVATTALALLGFSWSNSLWMLCLWAIPYGLGAGSVDATLNNYVALHYASRHMSWLHCMWGIGASTGPYIMGMILSSGGHWSMGYRSIGIAQVILSAILCFSLPIWKQKSQATHTTASKPLPLMTAVRTPGAVEIMAAFFCYCGLEQTVMLWGASYLSMHWNFTPEAAASYASLFFLGMTVGRAITGFLTFKFSDTAMIRMGQCIIALGIVIVLLPFAKEFALIGLLLCGLGCAPIYPCVIHSTPEHFGADKSQALIGIQMASAYVGTAFMPPLFGLIAEHVHIAMFGPYLLALLVVMAVTHEALIRKCK